MWLQSLAAIAEAVEGRVVLRSTAAQRQAGMSFHYTRILVRFWRPIAQVFASSARTPFFADSWRSEFACDGGRIVTFGGNR